MDVALATCRLVHTWPIPPTPDDPRPWEIDERPLQAALRERGARVHTPVWDDERVDWSQFDVVVPRTTWDYHHHHAAFVAWARRVQAHTRLVNPANILEWNTDKRYLRDLEVPQLPTLFIEDGRLPPVPWPRAFLKPAIGATAEFTLRFATDAHGLAAARAHLAAHPGVFLLQPYVASVETEGERSAIVVGGAVTHCVRKQPVPGDYRVQDDYGATDTAHEPSGVEQAFVARVVERLPADVAYARIDWLLGPDGPALIELEAVEPCLFLRHGAAAAERFADALLVG